MRVRLLKFLLTISVKKRGFLALFGIVVGLMINIVTIPFYRNSCDYGPSALLAINKRNALAPQTGEGVVDEFEPKIVVRDPSEMAAKMKKQKKVIRPHFYYTELGIKEKVLVAVLSTPSVLNKFGLPLNKTLNHHVDKLVVFADTRNEPMTNVADFPVVQLSKKEIKTEELIFHVTDYLASSFLSKYAFFVLVDGTKMLPYINGKALHRALSHISASHSLVMGMPLGKDSNRCSLDSGIVLSNDVLRHIGDNSKWCKEQANDKDINANLEKCAAHAANIYCSNRIQEKTYKSITLPNTVGHTSPEIYDALDKFNFKSEENDMPFSVTGINSAMQFYSTHHYFLTKEVLILKKRLNSTKEEVLKNRVRAKLAPHEETWPIGSPPPYKPTSRFDVIYWTGFNASHVFMPDEHRNAAPLSDALLRDITSVVIAGASHLTVKSEGTIQIQKLNYGYYKVDPIRGTDYVMSLQFKDLKTGKLVNKMIEASRSITNPSFVALPFTSNKPRLNIIVKVAADEVASAVNFITGFKSNKELYSGCSLMMALEVAGQSLSPSLEAEITSLRKLGEEAAASTGSSVKIFSINPPTATAGSGVSLVTAMDQITPSIATNSLVAVLSVHSKLHPDFIDRMRMNTLSGQQVFSPIVWGLFHPSTVKEEDKTAYAEMTVKGGIGHFLSFDYTAISFYIEDYLAARTAASSVFPLNENTSPPLSVYRMFLSFSDLHMLRAPEPLIKLPYVPVVCPPNVNIRTPEVVDKSSFSTPNQLGDLSVLMGTTPQQTNDAYYRYVKKHFLDSQSHRNIKWKREDFKSDDLCVENMMHSFGTRAQLSKLVMEYDRNKKMQQNQPPSAN